MQPHPVEDSREIIEQSETEILPLAHALVLTPNIYRRQTIAALPKELTVLDCPHLLSAKSAIEAFDEAISEDRIPDVIVLGDIGELVSHATRGLIREFASDEIALYILAKCKYAGINPVIHFFATPLNYIETMIRVYKLRRQFPEAHIIVDSIAPIERRAMHERRDLTKYYPWDD